MNAQPQNTADIMIMDGPNGCGRLAVMDIRTQSGRDACKGFLDILAGPARPASPIDYCSKETLHANLYRVAAFLARGGK